MVSTIDGEMRGGPARSVQVYLCVQNCQMHTINCCDTQMGGFLEVVPEPGTMSSPQCLPAANQNQF